MRKLNQTTPPPYGKSRKKRIQVPDQMVSESTLQRRRTPPGETPLGPFASHWRKLLRLVRATPALALSPVGCGASPVSQRQRAAPAGGHAAARNGHSGARHPGDTLHTHKACPRTAPHVRTRSSSTDRRTEGQTDRGTDGQQSPSRSAPRTGSARKHRPGPPPPAANPPLRAHTDRRRAAAGPTDTGCRTDRRTALPPRRTDCSPRVAGTQEPIRQAASAELGGGGAAGARGSAALGGGRRAPGALEEPGQVRRRHPAGGTAGAGLPVLRAREAGAGRGAQPAPLRAGPPWWLAAEGGGSRREGPLCCAGAEVLREGVAPGRGLSPSALLASPSPPAGGGSRPTGGAAAAAEDRGCRCRSSALIPGSRTPVAAGISEGGRMARGTPTLTPLWWGGQRLGARRCHPGDSAAAAGAGARPAVRLTGRSRCRHQLRLPGRQPWPRCCRGNGKICAFPPVFSSYSPPRSLRLFSSLHLTCAAGREQWCQECEGHRRLLLWAWISGQELEGAAGV